MRAVSGARHFSTTRFTGRAPIGTVLPICVEKQGIRIKQTIEGKGDREVMFVGGASSEVFSGETLARMLEPAHAIEKQVMEKLARGEAAPVLSQHTSAGVIPQVPAFIETLEQHLPWENADDWMVSLQVEGASAVFAAVDMLMQLQHAEASIPNLPVAARNKVAVGAWSYHGPISTSPGSELPIGQKGNQITYPVPSVLSQGAGESEADFIARIRREQNEWLDRHGHETAVVLVEPQWGISSGGQYWPKELCREFIANCQARGIYVLCDEIMCGLGRHGNGTLFLSKAWDLNPDAVTFGKAIACGVDLLSGCIVKHGGKRLNANKRTAVQMHTYAGSSARALTTATQVLKEVPQFYGRINEMSKVMKECFDDMTARSGGVFTTQGQGMLWGGCFSKLAPADRLAATKATMAECAERGVVLMFFPPSAGFIVCPVYDIDEADLRKGLTLVADSIEAACKKVAAPAKEPVVVPLAKERYAGPDLASLTAEQQAVFAPIQAAAAAGKAQPFLPLLANPTLCAAAQEFEKACLSSPALSGAEKNLVELMTAAARGSNAAWVSAAANSALPQTVREVIAARQTPEFESERESAIALGVSELLVASTLEEATYAKVTEHLGNDGVAQLVQLVSYHSYACSTMNVFDVRPKVSA